MVSLDRVISGDINFSPLTLAVLPLWRPFRETGSGNESSLAVIDSTWLEQPVDVFKCRNLLNVYFQRWCFFIGTGYVWFVGAPQGNRK